jgi:hypothetical protein
MKDDRDAYYIEKERRNAEMLPYVAGMFLFLFVCFAATLAYQALGFLFDHLY